MTKIKFFQAKNILVSLKAIVVSIIVAVLWWLLVLVGSQITDMTEQTAIVVKAILGIVLWLILWGYIARKLWNWK